MYVVATEMLLILIYAFSKKLLIQLLIPVRWSAEKKLREPGLLIFRSRYRRYVADVFGLIE